MTVITSISPAELHYAGEERDVEACYDENLEPEAAMANYAASITGDNGILNKYSTADGASTTEDDVPTDDKTSTTSEGLESACAWIFLGTPFFMLAAFVILSIWKTDDDFGNFWHLFAGGCLIVFVVEMFSAGIFGLLTELRGWDKSEAKLKPSEALAVAAAQICAYVITFVVLIIGAYLQHSYHYFH